MKLAIQAAVTAAILAVGATSAAHAAPVTLTGNHIKISVSDGGGLGDNMAGGLSLKYDPTGTKTFGASDFLSPGIPHDGFAINSLQTGLRDNDNGAGGGIPSGSGPTVILGGAFANMAVWSGTDVTGSLQVTNLYFFNDGDKQVNVQTTFRALKDLTHLAFVRSTDPDQDSDAHGTSDTLNQRGNALFGATDFVGSKGPVSGLTLGLLNLSGDAFVHNTAITADCCGNPDPYDVLVGFDAGPLGDYGLNLAWSIGDLTAGSSATVSYAYLVGGTGAVPEPATWAMLIAGLGGTGAMLRRRRGLRLA